MSHKLKLAASNTDDAIIKKNTSGGGGDDGGNGMNLEQRVDRLDQDVRDMRLDLAEIKGQLPHLATKAEVVGSRNTIIYWLIGLFVATGLYNHFFVHSQPIAAPASISQAK